MKRNAGQKSCATVPLRVYAWKGNLGLSWKFGVLYGHLRPCLTWLVSTLEEGEYRSSSIQTGTPTSNHGNVFHCRLSSVFYDHLLCFFCTFPARVTTSLDSQVCFWKLKISSSIMQITHILALYVYTAYCMFMNILFILVYDGKENISISRHK
jgi:hypothetical protein